MEFKDRGFYGKNFWGKTWTIISAVIIILTAVAIFMVEKREKQNMLLKENKMNDSIQNGTAR